MHDGPTGRPEHEGQEPVVRRQEELAVGVGAQDPPTSPDPGIDDRRMDRPAREKWERPGEEVGGPSAIPRRHGMTEVNNLGPRMDAEDRPMQEAGKFILEAKIGEQRDGRHTAYYTPG